MLTEEILTTDLTPLSGLESIEAVLERMEEESLTILPVVEERSRKLIGQITRSGLRAAENDGRAINTIELQEPLKIFQGQHLFEAARLLLQHELQILPVVNKDSTYLGIVARQDMLEILPRMLNLAVNGSILSVKLDKLDFTLSEMVHLIEVEGAKILGLTVRKPETEGDPFNISVKINLKDATRVTSSLRRHDYDVITETSGRDLYGFDMENRADELLKYIDM